MTTSGPSFIANVVRARGPPAGRGAPARGIGALMHGRSMIRPRGPPKP